MSASSSSSSESLDSAANFAALPVVAMKKKIVEKITENRVTLIVGETGCGKSSQVPQFLLEENMAPILCTQPRRFAVVAVARMVAKARKSQVGGEVGYHIGHSKVLSERSKIVFKTAGVLLDEMREKGLNALEYKVIILDEVHERSVESDLVLACVKQFMMRNNDLRVVLMSATADIARYRDYFKDLGRDERVEVLAIPNSSQQTLFQRRVTYLEKAVELLGMNSESMKYLCGPSPSMDNADIKTEVHKLIHDLVLHIHKNEPDIEKSILVFLPTYQSLEQQWYLMKPFRSSFKIHILHRSIDTEQALMAMKIWKSHRKVILATNIAESSVTIPKVAYVIDSCRSLQVFWDSNRKKEASELTWVSKSQAEQRRGRTGRTCDGQIFRLVTGSFFIKLQDYEPPAILRLSLRQQVLLTCCSESRAINDPKVLLQKALDPPDPVVVEDALRFLVRINALEKTLPRGRYEPTFYGRLLASFSLSFDASVLILKFGNIGMLREGILLGILMDIQPLPILHPFGQENLLAQYTDCYFDGDTSKNVLTGKREVAFIANLSAIQFWQRVFKDKHRLEQLKKVLEHNEMETTQMLLPLTKIEEEWCTFHMLVQSSLHQVSEIYEDVLNSVHRFRPKFLVKSDGLPPYYEPYEFEHTCIITCLPDGDIDALADDDDQFEPSSDTRKCLAMPFVGCYQFKNNIMAEKFALVIKELRIQYAEVNSCNQEKFVNSGKPSVCRFFVNGSCNRGNQCLFSHSHQANEVKGPTCKFFFSLQGCRNGDSCFFSHDLGQPVSQFSKSSECLPEDDDTDAALLLQLFPTSLGGRVLVFDDTDLDFTLNLAHKFNPFKIISTTRSSVTSISDPALDGVKILWGLSEPYQVIISAAGENPIPWNEIECILWFPNFDSYNGNLEGAKKLVQKFFEFLAVRILADAMYDVQVVLTMKNIRFSQLQVEKLGRDCFFFLKSSFPYDEASLGQLIDKIATKKPMVVSRAISYVFNLHPPTDIQFGDYATAFHKSLHGSQ